MRSMPINQGCRGNRISIPIPTGFLWEYPQNPHVGIPIGLKSFPSHMGICGFPMGIPTDSHSHDNPAINGIDCFIWQLVDINSYTHISIDIPLANNCEQKSFNDKKNSKKPPIAPLSSNKSRSVTKKGKSKSANRKRPEKKRIVSNSASKLEPSGSSEFDGVSFVVVIVVVIVIVVVVVVVIIIIIIILFTSQSIVLNLSYKMRVKTRKQICRILGMSSHSRH